MKRRIAAIALALCTLASCASAEQAAANQYRTWFKSGTFFVDYESEYKDCFITKAIAAQNDMRMERNGYRMKGYAAMFGGGKKDYPDTLYRQGKYYKFSTKKKATMAAWNQIGFVPFKDKDKVYKAYHEDVDQQFDRLKVDMNERKMQSFRNNVNSLAEGSDNKGRLYSERERLMRTYERMKNELQTYENNIGFLSVSSKGGGGLVKEMERKIEKLKEEMKLIIQKIDTIDENLE